MGLSGAGAGGLVDHLVDAEVALALVTLPEPPETVTSGWSGWAAPGKPLRWLRESREALDGGSSDPRVMTPSSTQTIAPERAELVDQAIRRILAGMRDWTPLLGASSEGTAALLILSRVRSDLMNVHERIDRGGPQSSDEAREAITDLRRRPRVLALTFEEWSGAPHFRKEVLTTMAPLPWSGCDFGDNGRSLNHRLSKAEALLAATDPPVKAASATVGVAEPSRSDSL